MGIQHGIAILSFLLLEILGIELFQCMPRVGGLTSSRSRRMGRRILQ